MLDKQNLIDHLRYNEVFELFPAHVRTDLFNKSEARRASAGQTIYATGEEANYMCALLAGRVRICIRSADGRELLLSRVERGRTFGETSVFDTLPRMVDAIADTDCMYLVITREAFMPVLLKHPDVMERVIRMLCHRTRLYVQKMELFALQDLPTRLAYSLLRLAKKYGVEQEGRLIVKAGLNQSDLAHKLAISRESANKHLHAFLEKGWIGFDGHDIVLLDVSALEAIAFPDPLKCGANAA